MLIVMLVMAIVGAVADWKYRRSGGVGSTSRDRLYFGIACVLSVGLIAVLGFAGGDAGAAGGLTAYMVVFLFILWELGRWRVRRKNPIPPPLPHVT
jgi:hypothetical protein